MKTKSRAKLIITSLLAIVCCMSLIAGATFALFTSESKVNIAIKSGKVDVVANIELGNTYSATTEMPTETDDYAGQEIAGGTALSQFAGTYYYEKQQIGTFKEGGTASINGNTLQLNKMIPGDMALSTVSFTNNSNVDILYRIKIQVTEGIKLYQQLNFKVKIGSLDTLQNFEGLNKYTGWIPLAAGGTIDDIDVLVELPLATGNEYQDLASNIVISVEAVQGNAYTYKCGATSAATDHKYEMDVTGCVVCSECGKVFAGDYFAIIDENRNVTDIHSLTDNAYNWAEKGVTFVENMIKYERPDTATAKHVAFKTSNPNQLLYIDAITDTVEHFGIAKQVYINNVASNSYDENGEVDDIVIMGKGHVAFGETAKVEDLSVAKNAIPAKVKITLPAIANVVETIAVYTEQQDIKIETKTNTLTNTFNISEVEAQKDEKNVSKIEIAENVKVPVVIIPKNSSTELARVGTELYGSINEAIEAVKASGEKKVARLVNDEIKDNTIVVPEGTIYVIAPNVELQSKNDTAVKVEQNAEFINIGKIINTSEVDESKTINNQGTLINIGGIDNGTGDGINNGEGKEIVNDGTFNNYGLISNSGKIKNNTEGNFSNKGTIENDGSVENNGSLDNGNGTIKNNEGAEIVNKEGAKITNGEGGSIENKGTIENNEGAKIENKDGAEIVNNEGATIKNDGELDTKEGEISGEGEYEGELEADEDYVARVNTNLYLTLKEAIADVKDNGTVLLLKDVSETVSINGVDGVTLDLDGKTITGTVTVYDLNGLTVKDGSVENPTGTAFRIGEHKTNVIIKWKYADQYPLYGNHPLAPAQNVELSNLTVDAKYIFDYVNINDDLTRGLLSNYCDNDLYGKYIYKTGYTTQEQSDYKKYDEVFTAINYTDTVTVNGGTYTGLLTTEVANNKLENYKYIGRMVNKDGVLYTQVLTINDGTFSDDFAGRFLNSGKYLVGSKQEETKSFVVGDNASATYLAKVNNNYYDYVGGANDAIAYAEMGETVYIKENATVEKYFEKDEFLFVVSEVADVAYTGAKTDEKYTLKTEEMQGVTGGVKFYSVYEPAVAVYATGQGGDWKKATKVDDYASLKDALEGLQSNYTIVIMKDFTVGDEMNYSYGGGTYKCALGYATRSTIDFNGHMITYTGTGACIVTSQSTGYLYVRDTSAEKTGGITATQGSCFRMMNAKSDYTNFYDVNFIAEKGYALYLDGGTGITINSGRYISKNKVSKGWKVTTLTISGGTFNYAPDSKYIASGKTAVDNGDGTWTVKAA